MSYDSEELKSAINAGSSKLWEKKNLPKYLIKKFFIGLIFAVIPIFWLWGNLFYFIREKSKANRSEAKGRPTDSYSAPFGKNDALHYRLGKKVGLIYIGTILALFILIGFLIGSWVYKTSGTEVLTIIIVIGVCMLIEMLAVQIHALHAFKYNIRPYACPKCGYANMQEKGYKSDFRTENWVSHRVERGYERQTGTIYLDGKKVGSISETVPDTVYKQNMQSDIRYREYFCSRCGYSHMVKSDCISKKIGDEYL